MLIPSRDRKECLREVSFGHAIQSFGKFLPLGVEVDLTSF